MKKGMVLVLVLAMVLSMTAVGFANFGVEVTIEPSSTATDKISVEQGETLILTATSDLGNGTYSFIEDLWTGAERQTGPSAGDSSTNFFVSTAKFSSIGMEVGSEHTVTYRIKVNRPGGGQSGTDYDDSDEAYIEIIQQEMTIVVEPMAAPSIAAKILEANGIQSRYGQGRNGGNFIADVARTMGPQAVFMDTAKAVWCDDAEVYVANPYYWNAVLNFLNQHTWMNEVLEGDFDWYVNSLK